VNPELYQRACEIFDRVCDLPQARRVEELTTACGSDAQLREAVLGLLAGDDHPTPAGGVLQGEGGSSLRAQLDQFLEASASGANDQARMPTHIGPYELVGFLGRGGLGEVFEARQQNPDRAVAVKLLRVAADSQAGRKRFRREVESLARLRHPGIATIFDAGMAEIGGVQAPYFVMELVRGTSLTTYANQAGLTINEKLELVARVCDAVQYAHQQGIIHRDLKPSNILVPHERRPAAVPVRDAQRLDVRADLGSPCVLDFGIARIINEEPSQLSSLATEAGQIIGTPGYMSPEQVRGEPGGVDSRTDIYALGVMLYELLTGKLPFDTGTGSVFELARRTIDDEPERLGVLNPSCRGDVETIVAAAMAKDKSRRYDAASQLADDLRRFITKQPITARRPTASYLFQRFAARNPALVVTISAAALLLMVSTVVITLFYLESESQRVSAQKAQLAAVAAERVAVEQREVATTAQARAEREAGLQRSIAEFLITDMLGAAAPNRLGANAKVSEVVNDAAKAVEGRFKDDVELRGRVRTTLANLVSIAGDAAGALGMIETALVELSPTGANETAYVLEARRLRAQLLDYVGKNDESERAYREVIERSVGPAPEIKQVAMAAREALGQLLQARGKHEEAEVLLREVIAAEPPTRASREYSVMARVSLAASLMARQRASEAEPLLREAVDLGGQDLSPDHPARIAALNNYSTLLISTGRWKDAAPIMEMVLASVERTHPSNHPNVAYVAGTTAQVLVRSGRVDEAKSLAARAVAVMRLTKDDGDFEIERVAKNAIDVCLLAKDPHSATPFAVLWAQARYIAAGVEEGKGVIARTGELEDLQRRALRQQFEATNETLEPKAVEVKVSEVMRSFFEASRTENALINAEGGMTKSAHAAKYSANLARAAWSLRERHPWAQALALRSLSDAKLALPVAEQPEKSRELIEAVERELRER
jgi:serine/threonine protein kinase/tetratricopeptide (TPR) repeat protein